MGDGGDNDNDVSDDDGNSLVLLIDVAPLAAGTEGLDGGTSECAGWWKERARLAHHCMPSFTQPLSPIFAAATAYLDKIE